MVYLASITSILEDFYMDNITGSSSGRHGGKYIIPSTGNFSLHHRIQNGSGAHLASYPMVRGALFLGVTRPVCEANHLPLHLVQMRCRECVELYFHSSHMPSWRGGHLKQRLHLFHGGSKVPM